MMMKEPVKKYLRFQLNEDTSYKIVAFFVTLVLWVTILGRKSSVITKEVNLEFVVKNNYQVTSEYNHKVKIQVSGPRMVLKKFSQEEQVYTADLWDREPGRHRVLLNHQGLTLPVGIKFISVTPREVTVIISEVKK